VDRIAAWCERYGLNESMMLGIFSQLYNENHFQAPPTPAGFRRVVPIAKFIRQDGLIYAVTHMRQYDNMSVVNVEIASEGDEEAGLLRIRVDLSVGPSYTCLPDSGGGGGRSIHYGFTVTPPLPDDTAAVEFSLKITPVPDFPARLSLHKGGTVVIK
jgi:hypothetical protein